MVDVPLFVNDCAYVAAFAGPQVAHKDLRPREFHRIQNTIALSFSKGTWGPFTSTNFRPVDTLPTGWAAWELGAWSYPFDVRHSKGGACNSHTGVPVPWVQVPFPEAPGSITFLHSLSTRAVEIHFEDFRLPRPWSQSIAGVESPITLTDRKWSRSLRNRSPFIGRNTHPTSFPLRAICGVPGGLFEGRVCNKGRGSDNKERPGSITSRRLDYNRNAIVVVPPWASPSSTHEVCAKAGCMRLVGARPLKCELCNA